MIFATVLSSSIKRTLVALVILASLLAGSVPVTVAQSNPPLDLAALILHPDDLYWLVDEPSYPYNDSYPYGQFYSTSFTTIAEAVRNQTYAEGRGGLALDLMGERDATAMLEDADWVRAHTSLMQVPAPGQAGLWVLGLAITIEEFETQTGAEQALAWFDNTDLLEELTISESAIPLEPALEIDGVNTRGWELVTHQYAEGDSSGPGLNFTTLWAQVDTMVVSVTMMSTVPYTATYTDLLVPLVELQLKRLDLAEYLYQPGLESCAPEFQDDRTTDVLAEYEVLNGRTFAIFEDTFDDLEVAQAENQEQGIIDSYIINQSIDDTTVGAYNGPRSMWFLSRIEIFTTDDAAEVYLAGITETLEDSPNNTEVEQVDDHPALGDGTVLVNYIGKNDYAATIIFVQIDNQVVSMRLGSMTDHQPEIIIELAEAQLDRMDGNCDDPLELPESLFDSATSTTHLHTHIPGEMWGQV